MINYKRIYPLRQNGRLGAVITVVGNQESCDIHIKFKSKPKLDELVIILFNPKTYEYIMEPIKEKLHLNHSATNLSACIIGGKTGCFIEFLMEGAISKTKYSLSKLKHIITMDIQSQGKYKDEYEKNKPLIELDRMKDRDKGEKKEKWAEQTMEMAEEQEKEEPTELIDYLRELEDKEGREPFPSADFQEASKEWGEGFEKDLFSSNEESPVMPVNIPQEVEDAKEKCCEFINPFKDRWNGVWWKVSYPNKDWHYIVGRIVVDKSKVSVIGVPGDRHTKPVCMQACDMYAIADNGVGYWLMFE